MTKKLIFCILGGSIGFLIGLFGGGFLGLVIGGTFLGGFRIYETTGFEGYELASYIGATIGAILYTLVGIKLSLNFYTKKSTL